MLKHGRLTLMLLFLLPSPTLAQPRVPGIFPEFDKWEVSAFFGVSYLDDNTFATAQEGGQTQLVGLNFANGYVAGARITENLGENFGAELEYSYANHPMTFENLAQDLPRLDRHHHVHKLSYSILYYPLDRHSRIRPFGSVGGGASFYQASGDAGDQAIGQSVELKGRWKAAFSYGGGVKIKLDEKWGLRADIRDHVTGVPDFALPSQSIDPAVPAIRPQGELHNWQVSLGILYTFDFANR
ncbi:MAG: outer membrane beta-barrel protein [Acidobacteriota bacterium]